MSKVKGTSKHGRAAELMRKLKYEHNFDAAEEMVKIFRTGKLRPMEKFKIAAELASYQYPKLKAMELKSNVGEQVTFNIDLTGTPLPSVVKAIEENGLSVQSEQNLCATAQE